MSLNIYIAHTGEHLLADPVSFASYVAAPVSMMTTYEVLDTANARSSHSCQVGCSTIMDCAEHPDTLPETDLDDCSREECQSPNPGYRGRYLVSLGSLPDSNPPSPLTVNS